MERNMKLSLQCNLNCKWKTYPFKIKAAQFKHTQPTQFKRCSFYFEDESSSFPVCVSLFEVSLTTHCLVCSLNYPDSLKRSRKPTLFFKCSAFEIDIVP